MNGTTIRVTLPGGAATRQHHADKIHVTPEGVLTLTDRGDRVLVTYAAGAWASAVKED